MGKLVDKESRVDRVVREGLRAPLIDVAVPFFDEEPVVPTALGGMYERPATPELVAPELEEELAVLDTMLAAGDLDPDTLVPADRRARAVLALGDDPLELRILQRVGLHMHGKPLVRRIRGGPLRDGPGLQDAVHFEPQIPVERAGVMLLHDKNAPLALGRRPSEGLRSVTGGTLVAVALELVVGFRRHGSD